MKPKYTARSHAISPELTGSSALSEWNLGFFTLRWSTDLHQPEHAAYCSGNEGRVRCTQPQLGHCIYACFRSSLRRDGQARLLNLKSNLSPSPIMERLYMVPVSSTANEALVQPAFSSSRGSAIVGPWPLRKGRSFLIGSDERLKLGGIQDLIFDQSPRLLALQSVPADLTS